MKGVFAFFVSIVSIVLTSMVYAGDWVPSGNNIYYLNGNVGIGTNTPSVVLTIGDGTVAFRRTLLLNADEPNMFFGTQETSVNWRIATETSAYNAFEIMSGNQDGYALDDSWTSRFLITANGNIGIGTISPTAKLDVNGSIKITGGSDIAEPFDVKRPELLEPGMVLSIDSENPGKLKISNKAYDRCIAGIVSGAGGIKSGMVLGQSGTIANGEYPVSLSGRVYAQCDASINPIQPGDLLTSSDLPGYAMKVTDHMKAQGAIVGKAMTGLNEGKGLVLVLVTLQ